MYKLIIVDDEQSIRNGMANGIPWNDWGFEVIGQASDGLEALELVENERPDVVLSDIRMPRMDGVELMQRLHKDYPDVKVCKVNVDEEPELSNAFKIVSIPTIVVIKNGEIIDSVVGYRPKEDIEKIIKLVK